MMIRNHVAIELGRESVVKLLKNNGKERTCESRVEISRAMNCQRIRRRQKIGRWFESGELHTVGYFRASIGVFRNDSRSPTSLSCRTGHDCPALRLCSYILAPCPHKFVARRTAVYS
jgi:hypothetical protein